MATAYRRGDGAYRLTKSPRWPWRCGSECQGTLPGPGRIPCTGSCAPTWSGGAAWASVGRPRPCSPWRPGSPVMAQCKLGRPAMGSDSGFAEWPPRSSLSVVGLRPRRRSPASYVTCELRDASFLSHSSPSCGDLLGVNEWHTDRCWSLAQAEGLNRSHAVGSGRRGCCTYVLYGG